jgi:hypothetical protein
LKVVKAKMQEDRMGAVRREYFQCACGVLPDLREPGRQGANA